jgi:hypothetical protein
LIVIIRIQVFLTQLKNFRKKLKARVFGHFWFDWRVESPLVLIENIEKPLDINPKIQYEIPLVVNEEKEDIEMKTRKISKNEL